jgi:hypothetical protein
MDMSQRDQFNVLIVGGLHPLDATDPNELRTWRPGSGQADDRVTTDRVIGAVLRSGYSIVAIEERQHALDVTVRPALPAIAPDASPDTWSTAEEAKLIAQQLVWHYPEFRPLLVVVAVSEQYGAADTPHVGRLAPEPAEPVAVEPQNSAWPPKEAALNTPVVPPKRHDIRTGQLYIAKGPSKQRIEVTNVGGGTVQVASGGKRRVLTIRTLKRDYSLLGAKRRAG